LIKIIKLRIRLIRKTFGSSIPDLIYVVAKFILNNFILKRFYLHSIVLLMPRLYMQV